MPTNRAICRGYISPDFFMIELKVNSGAIKLEEKNIERMMTDNPETRKVIQELIRETMWEARNATSREIMGIVGNKGGSARAVRNTVYQKILGGNISILDGPKQGSANWKIVEKVRKVEQNPHMRGGNRRVRSLRTAKIEGYEPKARGFILRWQDGGTKPRFIGMRNTMRNYGRLVSRGIGKRGQIIPGNFFYRITSKHLGLAAKKLAVMIDEEIAKIHDQNNI